MFFVMQAVAGLMVADGKGGVVINMASQAGRQGESASSVYAATKAAVISFTRSAALALINDGIRVNAIAPGVIETAMRDRIDALYAEQHGIPLGEKRRQVGRAVPIGRMGTPWAVAAVAVFLASAPGRIHRRANDQCRRGEYHELIGTISSPNQPRDVITFNQPRSSGNRRSTPFNFFYFCL